MSLLILLELQKNLRYKTNEKISNTWFFFFFLLNSTHKEQSLVFRPCFDFYKALIF